MRVDERVWRWDEECFTADDGVMQAAFGATEERAVGEARADALCDDGALCVRAVEPVRAVERLYREKYGVRDGVAMLAFRSKRDALECAARAFWRGRDVLLPGYANPLLREVLERAGAKIVEVEMRGERRMKVDADLIGFFYPYAGVLLATPSTETGYELGKREMKLIVTSRDGGDVVVVDEEYADYGTNSIVRFATKYKNVVTVRAMSGGYAMCGQEFVFAFGAGELIERMREVARECGFAEPDALAAAVAAAALRSKEYYDERRSDLVRQNGEAFRELKNMGSDAMIGRAPFFLLRPASGDLDGAEERLRGAGVRVGRMVDADGREFLRVGINGAEKLPLVYEAMGIEFVMRMSVSDPLLNRAERMGAFVETPPDPPLAKPMPPYRWQQMMGMKPMQDYDIEYWRKRRWYRYQFAREDGSMYTMELLNFDAKRRRERLYGEHAHINVFGRLWYFTKNEKRWEKLWRLRREFEWKYGKDNFPTEGWLDE